METYNQDIATETPDILVDLEPQLEQAGAGKRLANYLIDIISFYIFVFALGMLSAVVSDNAGAFFDDMDSNPLLSRLISLALYGCYMGLVEMLFKGKSLGKLITQTRAVNEDGSQISGSTAFLRGLSRAVPFDAFSALGSPPHPWHDRWNRTYVIDEKRSVLSY